MKLHKALEINGEPHKLVNESIQLDLFLPGRASFTVVSRKPLKGLIRYRCGYDLANIKPYFLGYVETATTVDQQQQRLFCRELSASLYYPLSIIANNVALLDVLDQLSSKTGLRFITPDNAPSYLQNRTAKFYALANGYYALRTLSKVFGYQQPLWQQEADGSVYVGAWSDSRWASTPVSIPNRWQQVVGVADGARVPAIPALRPGVQIDGRIVTQLTFADVHMHLSWSENPWSLA
ncbi:hypothetical protein [Marinibactrum halimedae]|uniref:Uncharacterized protein n=1 Tax=Marinibactrum halimedae TaxID=1444977 RepID=A0AA37WLM6_9GAMM|nr:hypothetical protein [Marinibactrum halimedae]MCD9458452.1 hypothetical protein [Marinibactrum halimedae]GLS26149.1 hypothetical protein GCM10007877_18640 [Marinibactrum halimedae]